MESNAISNHLPTPPGPRHSFFLGSWPNVRRDMLGTMRAAQAEFGDVVRLRLGPKSIVVLSHPELAERVFIGERERFVKIYERFPRKGLALIFGKGVFTSVGLEWRRQRQIMQPTFHRSPILSMAPIMTAAGERLLQRWKNSASSHQPVDLLEEMSQVTMDIIATTMFSANVLGRAHALAKEMATCVRYVGDSFINPLMLPPWVPTRRNRDYVQALRSIDSLIYEMIETHQKKIGSHGDLLDMLLVSRFPESGEPMSAELVRDQVAGIFGAGHETTSCALTWTLFLLHRHPEARMRLNTELLALNGVSPTAADLPRLPYTRMLLEESMRLFPPVPTLPRIAKEDVEINGYVVPKGTMVLVNFYNIHRHPDFWSDPDQFIPERFAPDSSEQRHRCAYLPFGVGPRVCLGSHFAMMEAQLLLAQIAQKYEVRFDVDDVETEVVTTLRPRHPLMATLHPIGH